MAEPAASISVSRPAPAPSVTGPRPWRLPPAGLAVYYGPGRVARLSHYFLPRLVAEGRRVLVLDGANSADPRLLARLARESRWKRGERAARFEDFNRQVRIARAFTCFQLTELVRRVPRFLGDFPAQVLMVTALPDLYFDEDVRDWDARVAFEQALKDLRRYGGGLAHHPFVPSSTGEGNRGQCTPLAVAVFSAAPDFSPTRARRRFFAQASAAATEVWAFRPLAGGGVELVCERSAIGRAGVTPALPLRPNAEKAAVRSEESEKKPASEF